jgi:hypothetical protein
MKISKGHIVKVVGDDVPTRYFGRTGVVLKKSRDGYCQVKFPDAHRVTPLQIFVDQLEIL